MIVFAQFMFEYNNTIRNPCAIMFKNCLFIVYKLCILAFRLLDMSNYIGRIGKNKSIGR